MDEIERIDRRLQYKTNVIYALNNKLKILELNSELKYLDLVNMANNYKKYDISHVFSIRFVGLCLST